MTKVVLTPPDLGAGLGVENRKVVVKVDGVSVRINEQGQLVAEHTVDVALQGATVNDQNELVLTLSNGTQLPPVSMAAFLNVGDKVVSGVAEGNTITFTRQDQSTFAVDLTPFLESIRFERLESVGGEFLGYTVVE